MKEGAKNLYAFPILWGWEDTLEKGLATHSSILALEDPMDRGTWWAIVHGVPKSQTRLSN